MKPDKSIIVIAAVVAAAGIGNLLSIYGFVPTVNWPWTLGVCVAGLLMIVMNWPDRMAVGFGGILVAGYVIHLLGATQIVLEDAVSPLQFTALALIVIGVQFLPPQELKHPE